MKDCQALQPLLQSSLHVNTDLNELSQVLVWFDQFNHAPLPYHTWLQCQLALVEGFTNAVRHAHYNLPIDCLIKIEGTLLSDQIEMRIWDQGGPFNLNQALNNLPQEMDCFAEGGRGLKLMQRIADSLSYTREENNYNCLRIIKYF